MRSARAEEVIAERGTTMPPDSIIDIDEIARRVAEHLAPLLRSDPDRLLDRRELAQRLGVAERTITAMTARHELPPPLLGTAGTVRWCWAQVEKHLVSRQGRPRRKGRGIRRGGSS